jgi:hypothetical protein
MDVSGQVDTSGILVGHASDHLVFWHVMIVRRVISFWRHNCFIANDASQWGLGFS